MLAGSIFPDVCVPTWLALIGAIFAAVALVSLLLRALGWWREREERRERRQREGRRERERLSLPRWIELTTLVVGTAIAVAGILHCGTPDVRISLADSRLHPAGGETPSEEYVCLVNYEDHSVSLAGWELRGAERLINVLPDFTLEPGAAVRVHPGEGTNSRRDLYGEEDRRSGETREARSACSTARGRRSTRSATDRGRKATAAGNAAPASRSPPNWP